MSRLSLRLIITFCCTVIVSFGAHYMLLILRNVSQDLSWKICARLWTAWSVRQEASWIKNDNPWCENVVRWWWCMMLFVLCRGVFITVSWLCRGVGDLSGVSNRRGRGMLSRVRRFSRKKILVKVYWIQKLPYNIRNCWIELYINKIRMFVYCRKLRKTKREKK